MSKKRKKQPIPLADKILIPVLLLAAAGSAALVINYKTIAANKNYNDILKMDVIYNNVFINNYEVAGLTKEQALEKLTREQQEGKFEKRVINLQLADGGLNDVVPITYKECGMKYNYAPEIEEAYAVGRKGSAKARRDAIEELENKGEFFTSEYTWDREMVIQALHAHEAEINAPYVNGEKMDIEKTADLLESMLEIDAYDSSIDVPVTE